MRRVFLVILACAGAAWAGDGASAPPERWTHPAGAAACTTSSRARPPESIGGIDWRYKAKGSILAPPVTWDGAIFLVDGGATKATLIALDAHTGKVWARMPLKNVGAPSPAVYARSVYVREGGERLVQFQLAGRKLTRGWSYDVGGKASAPRVIDGEIYVASPAALLALRPGRAEPVWSVKGTFVGEIAVRDRHVYALRKDAGKLVLATYARKDGAAGASVEVADATDGPGAEIRVGRSIAGVRLPGADEDWVLVQRRLAKGKLQLKAGRTENLVDTPFVGSVIVIGITKKPPAVTLLRFAGKQARRPLIPRKDRPELFEGTAGCVWLGEASQCFGTWLGDVNGNNIFWTLRDSSASKAFPDGVRFHAVPAGHERLLLVPKNARSLIALGPERIE